MEIAGIPTLYNQLQFRSRLEAQWAALFDLLGWKYEYEPYDLPGWIPDFLLLGHDEILVEVKPFTSLDEFNTAKIVTAMEKGGKRGKEVLLLGCTIFESKIFGIGGSGSGYPCIGWLGESLTYEESPKTKWLSFDEGILNHYRDGKWGGLFHGMMSYHDRIDTGHAHYGGHPPGAEMPDVLKLWAEAKNQVQWNREEEHKLSDLRTVRRLFRYRIRSS